MGIFGKKKTEDKQTPVAPQANPEVVAEKKAPVVKVEKKTEKKAEKKSDQKVVKKGTSANSYIVLIKPLITEKASELNALNKYAFAVNPKMNKIEIKKAIRKIYEVDPVDVNVLNFSGKNVRYGKAEGRTKKWKKAIVTLKAGDNIEVYEGV